MSNLPDKSDACPKSRADEPYNAFEHLCSSLFLSDESVVAVLTGFFDESGTHANQNTYAPTLTVAGYVSRYAQWVKFSHEWKGVLDEAGIPFFHMKDFEARYTDEQGIRQRTGLYKGWSNEKSNKVYKELCRLANWYTIMPVSSSVVLSDYEEVVTGKYRELFGSPYTFNSQVCWRIAGRWAEANGVNELITYVFESGCKYQGELARYHAETYNDEEQRARLRLGDLAFADKKRVRPLQAADINAYEVRKEMLNHLDPNQEKFFRARYRDIAKGYWHKEKYLYWAKDNLVRLIARLERGELF